MSHIVHVGPVLAAPGGERYFETYNPGVGRDRHTYASTLIAEQERGHLIAGLRMGRVGVATYNDQRLFELVAAGKLKETLS